MLMVLAFFLGWLVSLSAFAEQPAGSGARVVFLGDSLTAGGDWDDWFPDVDVRNEGGPGDTTRDILKRLDRVIEARPVKIFLMAGINDFGLKYDGWEVALNHRRILTRLITALPRTRIYLLSILPINPSRIVTQSSNLDIRRLNERLKEMSRELNVTYIDIHFAMADRSGRLNRHLTTDGIHLNARAYQIWREVVAPYVYE